MSLDYRFPNPNRKLVEKIPKKIISEALKEMKKDLEKEQFEKARNDPNAYDSASVIDIELNSETPKESKED